MSPSTPGLTEHPPEPEWLSGPRGRLAWYPYPAKGAWLRVLVSHGFGEHSGWWHHVARALAARGVATYLYDQYHHGLSEGAPGDAPSYGLLSDGFRLALARVEETSQGTAAPLVVLAHSNGALIALRALQDIPAATIPGLVLSSPFLGMPRQLAVFGTLLASLLNLFAPRLKVPNLLRADRLTTESSIWPQYTADPLRFQHLTPRFFLAMRRAVAGVPSLRFPAARALLLLVAGEERVVSVPALRGFFERIRSRDKTLRTFPGLRHELFNAPEWEALVDEVVEWCRERFGRGEEDAAGGETQPDATSSVVGG